MGIDEIEIVIAHGLLTGEVLRNGVLGNDPILVGGEIE